MDWIKYRFSSGLFTSFHKLMYWFDGVVAMEGGMAGAVAFLRSNQEIFPPSYYESAQRRDNIRQSWLK